jgi:hypothetical protein
MGAFPHRLAETDALTQKERGPGSALAISKPFVGYQLTSTTRRALACSSAAWRTAS